jgi:two-component system phosphate regulon sensor histidine kinase PhoR
MQEGKKTHSEFHMVAAAAHDLKTPLTYIRGAASAVKTGAVPLDQQLQHLERIEQSAERMLHLIDGLIGTVQADQQKLLLEPVNAVDVIASAIADVLPYAEQLGHDIKLAYTRNLPLIISNRLGLRRIIYNLLDNAVRYSRDEKPILVRARRDAGMVRISVRDYGLGVKKRDLEQIFKLFGRATNPTQNVPGSSGLGLFIATELSASMNSELKARSLSKGTSFFIRIPSANQMQLF